LEVLVRISPIVVTVLSIVILGSAVPAASAQSFGAGISFMSGDRGPGVLLDFSSPITTRHDSVIGWVGELGFNHKGFGDDFAGVAGGVNTLTLQGGARVSGTANDKISWLAQGLLGVMRTSFSVDAAGASQAVCDAYGIECSAGASDTSGVLTLGGGLEYALSQRTGVRGQIDFPIALGSDGGSTSRVSIVLVYRP
jgi:hypothetical protein